MRIEGGIGTVFFLAVLVSANVFLFDLAFLSSLTALS